MLNPVKHQGRHFPVRCSRTSQVLCCSVSLCLQDPKCGRVEELGRHLHTGLRSCLERAAVLCLKHLPPQAPCGRWRIYAAMLVERSQGTRQWGQFIPNEEQNWECEIGLVIFVLYLTRFCNWGSLTFISHCHRKVSDLPLQNCQEAGTSLGKPQRPQSKWGQVGEGRQAVWALKVRLLPSSPQSQNQDFFYATTFN